MCFPESISNSEPSPPASCVAMDDIEKSENLGPADVMVVLDIIIEGENINSHKFSPESILTDPHKMSRTIQRTSPVTNMILKGFINFHIKSRFPVMCSPPKRSLLIKITNKRHTDNIPVYTVEKLVDMRRPERIDNQIRRILILDSEENKGNRTSVCAIYRFGDSHMCLPESSPNSEQSPHASYMAVDDIERSKTLGPGDITVVLDMIGEGENINSNRFSLEPTITDQHKRSRTIQE